jgi:hypothetical protein
VSGEDDLSIGLMAMPPVEAIDAAVIDAVLAWDVPPARRDAIKFSEAVPWAALERMVAARDADEAGTLCAVGEPIVVG